MIQEDKSHTQFVVIWTHRVGKEVTRDVKLFEDFETASAYGRSKVGGFQDAQAKNYFVMLRQRQRYGDEVVTKVCWSIIGEK